MTQLLQYAAILTAITPVGLFGCRSAHPETDFPAELNTAAAPSMTAAKRIAPSSLSADVPAADASSGIPSLEIPRSAQVIPPALESSLTHQAVRVERWPSRRIPTGRVSPDTEAHYFTNEWKLFFSEVHDALHKHWSQSYLRSLNPSAPHHLQAHELSATVELAIVPSTGQIHSIFVSESSGHELFDAAALEAFILAFPRSTPAELAATDGLVHLAWELHRRPEYACSTYFARPLILSP